MKNKVTGIFTVLALTVSAFLWSGCTKQAPASTGKKEVKANPQILAKDVIKSAAQPADQDIIKAIDDSGVMKRPDGSFTIVPPVKIVHLGKQNKEGAWPVMARFTLSIKTRDGKLTPPTETTTSFRIFHVRDNAGRAVWTAQLGT